MGSATAGSATAGIAPAGIALAAGEGRRLRPLTEHRPKALVEVGGRTLLDGALDRLAAVVGGGPEQLAVNAHHHAAQVVDAAGTRAHVAVESPEALGTAGGVAGLAGWRRGRDVLVTNADVWMPRGAGALTQLLDGWDGERCRLLCAPAGPDRRTDFTTPGGAGVHYLGSCLLPDALVRGLAPVPSGLYEVLWRDLAAAGRLDLVVADAVAVDCGTPADLAAARALDAGETG